jgi:hypothetical protein
LGEPFHELLLENNLDEKMHIHNTQNHNKSFNMQSLEKKESCGRDSVVSYKSLNLFRESVGVLHSKVDKIFKDAPTTKIIHERSASRNSN